MSIKLIWIVKNGIKLTGMPAFGPTHSDDEIWAVIRFLRHLPQLTEQEEARLKPSEAEDEHHH